MPAREGNLEAPARRPIPWQDADFRDSDSLYAELERVFDICHGCRRCVSLCDAFPTLFDLVDESETLEVDGVDKADYAKVVEQCFMCDLCAETKCPYLPPHEWAVDFPHLMLRAKAYQFAAGDTRRRDRLITSTDPVFATLSTPGIAALTNRLAASPTLRRAGERLFGLHHDAPLPRFTSNTATRRLPSEPGAGLEVRAGAGQSGRATTGKVAIYVTCYGDCNEPAVVEDLVAVLNHNGVPVKILADTKCCGMPKLELGDLEKVAALKEANTPVLLQAVRDGYDITAPIPSCLLMYRQELPLLFPDDLDIARVRTACFDPFEYLMARHRDGLVDTHFASGLGKVAYHVACHQRVQAIGSKTQDFLGLIPDTEVTAIERCSGHDGTYAAKAETYDKAMKIARPVVKRVRDAAPDTFGSDCPMAGRMIAHGLGDLGEARHPISMVRKAYGI
jgi:Fe-S oxidoreductase